MAAQQQDKWEPFIEAIDKAETPTEKFNLLAAMVRLMATNDLVCIEGKIALLNQKFDAYMKKIVWLGLVIIALLFTGVDIKTIIDLVMKLAR